MSYDHHKKAGNQGDVLKHVALAAILDSLLADHATPEFRYADTFAGYAYSPIVQGNEWEKGVGLLLPKGHELSQNRHTDLWYSWYLKGRPQLLGGVYPGSSLIATDMCYLHRKSPNLALWDVSSTVVANLMETYQGQDHRIYCRPAGPNAGAIRAADLLFIDPPGLRTQREPSYPEWNKLLRFMKQRRNGQSVMIWLPVKAVTTRTVDGKRVSISPPGEDQASIRARADAQRLGFQTMRVRWSTAGRTIGCLLMCHAPDSAWSALEAAVRRIVDVLDWQAALHDSLASIS